MTFSFNCLYPPETLARSGVVEKALRVAVANGDLRLFDLWNHRNVGYNGGEIQALLDRGVLKLEPQPKRPTTAVYQWSATRLVARKPMTTKRTAAVATPTAQRKSAPPPPPTAAQRRDRLRVAWRDTLAEQRAKGGGDSTKAAILANASLPGLASRLVTATTDAAREKTQPRAGPAREHLRRLRATWHSAIQEQLAKCGFDRGRATIATNRANPGLSDRLCELHREMKEANN